MPKAQRRKSNAKETAVSTPAIAVAPATPRWRDWIAAVVVLPGIILLVFNEAVLRGNIFAHSDICFFFEPMRAFMHESLRAGRLPLWTPYIFCGYPLAAEGQSAVFYPPSLFISWLLPSFSAITWLVISHLIFAAIGMFLFARTLRLDTLPALFSGLIFSLSGFLLAHSQHVSLVCAAAWMPWTLLFILRAWHGSRLRNSVGAALCWGVAALCGHPQTLFLISATALALVCWKVVEHRAQGANALLRKAVPMLLLIFILGIGLASVQLLMTADLSRTAPHGERGTLKYVTSYSLLPHHLLGLLAPNWQGSVADNTYRGERYFWEYVLYLGVIPLFLALAGVFRREARIWAWFALGALVLALAQGNPLYQVLRFLPGFADFRVPARWILVFTFAAAVLAAYGLQQFLQLLTRVRWLAASPRTRDAISLGCVLAGLIPLALFGRSVAPLADAAAFNATPSVVQFLKEDTTWGRSFVITPIPIYADWSPPQGWAGNPDGWMEARVYLPADVPQSYDLATISGYAGFVDPRHADFFGFAQSYASQQSDLSLYSLVGTRYFVMPPTAALANLPATEVPPFRVFRNEAAFPRAFAVTKSLVASTEAQALEQLTKLAQAKSLLETAVTRGGEAISGNSAAVLKVEELRPEHITVRVQNHGKALVVLNERWDHGWRALVDGRPAPLYETDCVLMSVPVADGEHLVEFSYQPSSLLVGRVISLTALALSLFLLLLPSLPRPFLSR